MRIPFHSSGIVYAHARSSVHFQYPFRLGLMMAAAKAAYLILEL
jgi:hypothetical protein